MRKREKKAEVEERGQRRGRKIERGRGGDIMMNEREWGGDGGEGGSGKRWGWGERKCVGGK